MQLRSALLTFVAMGGFASPVVFASPSSGDAQPYAPSQSQPVETASLDDQKAPQK